MLVTPAYSTTITTYSSLASWQAAASGVQTDNFEGLAPGGSYTLYNNGIFQNGVEFIGITPQNTGVMDTTMSSWYNFGTGDAGFVTGPPVNITLPTAATAFSINLFTNPAAVTYTVTVLSMPFSVPTFTTSTGPAFFGITSDTAFSTLQLQVPAGGNYAFFDNFQWGTAQVTTQAPEAGTFLLIGSGLIGIAFFRKRRSLRRS